MAQTLFFIGDFGTGTQGQRDLAELMGRHPDKPNYILTGGDNFYESGVDSVKDPNWENKYRSVYTHPSLQVNFYACLGNHDYYSGNPDAQIEYSRMKMDHRWKMPGRYYERMFHIPGGGTLHVVVMDTYQMAQRHSRVSSRESGHPPLMLGGAAVYNEQLDWLKRKLQRPATWKIVVGHYPIYSIGDHGDTRELGFLADIFRQNNVTAYFCGHDHSMQHIQKGGMNYFVGGSSGARGGTLNNRISHKANDIKYATTGTGFIKIRPRFERISVSFHTLQGGDKPVYQWSTSRT